MIDDKNNSEKHPVNAGIEELCVDVCVRNGPTIHTLLSSSSRSSILKQLIKTSDGRFTLLL